jgi:hypothetical protein
VALTINRLCGSALQAVVSSSQNILLGDSDYGIGGGVEVMSRGGYLSQAMRNGAQFPPPIVDETNRIISGNHRVTSYCQEYGSEHEIDVIVESFPDEAAVIRKFAEENGLTAMDWHVRNEEVVCMFFRPVNAVNPRLISSCGAGVKGSGPDYDVTEDEILVRMKSAKSMIDANLCVTYL